MRVAEQDGGIVAQRLLAHNNGVPVACLSLAKPEQEPG